MLIHPITQALEGLHRIPLVIDRRSGAGEIVYRAAVKQPVDEVGAEETRASGNQNPLSPEITRHCRPSIRTPRADVTAPTAFGDANLAGAKGSSVGRGERIRTSGPCLPKTVLYQAELLPDRCARSQ